MSLSKGGNDTQFASPSLSLYRPYVPLVIESKVLPPSVLGSWLHALVYDVDDDASHRCKSFSSQLAKLASLIALYDWLLRRIRKGEIERVEYGLWRGESRRHRLRRPSPHWLRLQSIERFPMRRLWCLEGEWLGFKITVIPLVIRSDLLMLPFQTS